MTRPFGLTRREFVGRSAVCGGSFWLLWTLPRPLALEAARQSTDRLVFSESEWELVEAITGRIIPTDEDPGAVEAGCVNFIDKSLAYEEAGQRDLYHVALEAIDDAAQARFGERFAALRSEQQDEALLAVESGQLPGWPSRTSSQEFFQILCTHTIIGFLADPSYGGNLDYAGWKAIGYPGPRHEFGGYTPEQMIGEAAIQTVWGSEID
ncbi:MAG: gluconate 2-dehydrogenase subunit 3 family protein [Gemmatimonadota bacterium]